MVALFCEAEAVPSSALRKVLTFWYHHHVESPILQHQQVNDPISLRNRFYSTILLPV